jgi:hypothetical protein
MEAWSRTDDDGEVVGEIHRERDDIQCTCSSPGSGLRTQVT